MGVPRNPQILILGDAVLADYLRGRIRRVYPSTRVVVLKTVVDIEQLVLLRADLIVIIDTDGKLDGPAIIEDLPSRHFLVCANKDVAKSYHDLGVNHNLSTVNYVMQGKIRVMDGQLKTDIIMALPCLENAPPPEEISSPGTK